MVLEVDESVPMVTTDAGLLERVVANLVGNAVRVSAGRPVRVQAHVMPTTVEIMVVDQGPAYPRRAGADVRAVPAARRHLAGGLGLGLAVARGLTEAIGGTLSAEDTPGGGLTMVLAVPRAEQ